MSVTQFDRATDRPAEMVSIQYDKRGNLIAMAAAPAPYIARRDRIRFPARYCARPIPIGDRAAGGAEA